jgi:hypothetical protein
MPKVWTPTHNDVSIFAWMVSGDTSYLKTMIMRSREDTLSLCSARWAIQSLSRQYTEDAGLKEVTKYMESKYYSVAAAVGLAAGPAAAIACYYYIVRCKV